MIVKAEVRLYYDSGQNLSFEGLWAVIKFKEKGKFFKTKLERRLLSYSGMEMNYMNYIERLEKLSENKSEIISMIKDTVKNYFYKKYTSNELDIRKIKALEKLDEISRTTIDVHIKE